MNKAVIIIAKIAEVFHWVGCGILIALSIVFGSGKMSLAHYLSDVTTTTPDLELYGFTLETTTNENIPTAAFVLFFIGGAVVLALMALIFRNIYLVFKTAQGETKYSEGVTPFQQPIVNMIRKIGILCLAIPAVELVMSIISNVAFGNVESSVQFGTVLFGLIILCLSRFFAYGLELQKETEGLV